MNAQSLGLAWTLIRTDFKTRFHGTFSGFVWALLKPAALFVVLMSVFSFLFKDPAYKLQLVVGLFLWDFFAEGTKSGLAALHTKSFLFRKLRVPLWILVVAAIANPLITLAVFTVVIVAFLTVMGQAPSLAAIGLFGFYCLALALIVVGRCGTWSRRPVSSWRRSSIRSASSRSGSTSISTPGRRRRSSSSPGQRSSRGRRPACSPTSIWLPKS